MGPQFPREIDNLFPSRTGAPAGGVGFASGAGGPGWARAPPRGSMEASVAMVPSALFALMMKSGYGYISS